MTDTLESIVRRYGQFIVWTVSLIIAGALAYSDVRNDSSALNKRLDAHVAQQKQESEANVKQLDRIENRLQSIDEYLRRTKWP